jgi:hypothetical protein
MIDGYKINQFTAKRNDVDVNHIPGGFVRVEHIESGISVTKHGKTMLEARIEATEECKDLVEIYFRRK